MKYVWNSKKAKINLKKHGVDFADAIEVFEDLCAITCEDADHSEERFITMGLDAFGRIIVVVYTYRGEKIRLISARKANKKEQKQYYKR